MTDETPLCSECSQRITDWPSRRVNACPVCGMIPLCWECEQKAKQRRGKVLTAEFDRGWDAGHDAGYSCREEEERERQKKQPEEKSNATPE